MKKYLLAVACAALLTPAFAGIDEGIDKGMVHLSILGGFTIPAQAEYDTDVYGSKLDFGDVGGMYGAQIMYHLTPAFGLGLEVNGKNFSEAEYSVSALGMKEEYNTKASMYQFMLAGKVSFSPASKTRLYIPFAVGMARYTGKLMYKEYTAGIQTDSANNEQTSTKPSFYAGLGFETDLNDIFVFGAEARYNMFWIDKDKFADTKYLSDVSVLLKLGIKF